MKRLTGILAVVAVLALAVSAQATTMIGVNFTGNGGDSLGVGESAGVVPQLNWNNVGGGNGGPVALNDSTGAASGATVTYSSHNGGAAEGNVPSTTDEKLCDGFIYSYWLVGNQPGGAAQCVVTINNIPVSYQTAGYDVYIYVTANRGAGDLTTQEITAASTNWYNDHNPYANPLDPGNLVYTEVTSNSSANPTPFGSYVHVTGQTGSSFTFTCQTDPNEGWVSTPGVYGVQLVQLPEPATMVLLALGGVGLVVIRRRR